MANRNPFIYGRPARGNECICRESQMQTVFNRLRNAESTAIIGEPHIGKTSFLFQITEPTINEKYLEDNEQKLIFTHLDLHSIDNKYTPTNFWADALEPLFENKVQSIKKLVETATRNQYSRASLDSLFIKLASQNKVLVLLLDEFERLLLHPNFKEPDFYGLLRSLSTRTGGLAIIIASRISISGLNQIGREFLEVGSPFFNNMIEVSLPPFSDSEIDLLLGKAKPEFSSIDKMFIRRVAGRNPFLLQAMAGNLQELELSPLKCENAAELFYKRTVQYFDDLWNYLDDNTRTIAVILSLQDIGGRALGSYFNYGEIERVDVYGIELQKLAERGLAEQIEKPRLGWIWDSKNLLVWRGERWGISCGAFSWWVRDVVISAERSIPKYNEWLKQKKYIGLLTQKQWDTSQRLIKKIPATLLHGVAGLAKSILEEIIKTK